MADNTQTIVIDNLGGPLTRVLNGNLKSGLAKFDTSWGYNPFWKPRQLTWLKAPFDATSLISSGVALAGASRVEAGVLVNYIITSTGHLFRIVGEGASGSDIRTLATGSPTFTYGADIRFYGAANTLYISHDLGLTKIVIDGSGNFVSETQIGTWDSTHFTAITTRRAMMEFTGNLYIVNSDASVTYANNLAQVNSSGTVVSYAVLSPSLPAGTFIRDLKISSDLNYLLMTASLIPSELTAPVNDTNNEASSVSSIYQWNGSDLGVTAGFQMPNFGITATQVFGNKVMSFMYDMFGCSVFEGMDKVLTMRNNKSPFPSATSATGNMAIWGNPYFYWNKDTGAGGFYGSIYGYGSFDSDFPVGLYRFLQQTSLIGGAIYSVPFLKFTTNRYLSVNTSATSQVDSNGTVLYSFIDYSGSGGATNFKFYGFYLCPPDDSPSGWTGPTAGVYETQTQLFSKRITVKQIRVYTEPTVSNNGFNLDLIGSDGKKITNGSFSYTFASGSDPTTLQGALERIDFNPAMKDTYALALRVTNTGSANMVINKIEVDYQVSGK